MTFTSAPARQNPVLTPQMTLVRCKWCGKPQFEVAAPTVARFTCNDRGCKMQQTIQLG